MIKFGFDLLSISIFFFVNLSAYMTITRFTDKYSLNKSANQLTK